ncbi:MAG: dihydrofolate reductase family protein [Ktedonobacteraceae bacterium]
MNNIQLTAFEHLFGEIVGYELPLPPELTNLYGHLSFPLRANHPYIIGNFVSTLDGAVTLNVSGHNDSSEISGFNQQDHMLMGILRAISDAIIVGAGTLRVASNHQWTPSHIYPPLTDAYSQLRNNLGKSELPFNVFVTEHGNINLHLPVFNAAEIPVLIVTTKHGHERLIAQNITPSVQIATIAKNTPLSAQDILNEVTRIHSCNIILTEGGPKLFGNFLSEKCLDELFLTLAPQIAGRDEHIERGGIVAGKIFAPEHPLWGKLISIKRGGSHLFLRYAFESTY